MAAPASGEEMYTNAEKTQGLGYLYQLRLHHLTSKCERPDAKLRVAGTTGQQKHVKHSQAGSDFHPQTGDMRRNVSRNKKGTSFDGGVGVSVPCMRS